MSEQKSKLEIKEVKHDPKTNQQTIVLQQTEKPKYTQSKTHAQVVADSVAMHRKNSQIVYGLYRSNKSHLNDSH